MSSFNARGFGGKRVVRRDGKEVILLNPAEKGRKYAAELSTGMRYTNDGNYKKDASGDVGLSKEGRAYRSGYLDARRDSAKAYKHNLKKRV